MLYDNLFDRIKIIFTRKRLIGFFGVIIVFVFGYVVVNYSWLEVGIKNSTGSSLTATATNQSDITVHISSSKNSKIKLFVKKGDYEVLVRSGTSSYFTVVKARGFFTTAKKVGSLQKEYAREYVGNNPFYCMSDIGTILLSYNCEGNFNSATLHLPATTSTPTLTETDTKAPDGGFGGMVSYKNQHIVLINSKDSITADSGYFQFSHTLYSVSNVNGRPQYTVVNTLNGLTGDLEYTLSVYGEKLGLFSKIDPSKFYILDDLTSQPTQVNLSVTQKEESLYNNYTSNGFMARLYTTPKGLEKRNFSRVVITSKDASFDYTFKHYYESGFVCGKQLCMRDGSKIDVYKINPKKAELLYQLTSAWQAIPNEAGLLFSTEKGDAVLFNTDTQDGYSLYRLGGFALVSMTENGKDDYLLSMTNGHFDTFVLRLTNSPDLIDEIDKKLDALRALGSVSSLSVQGAYIFIVPNRGEVVYDITTNNFDYDPQKTQEINAEIDAKIQELKIDTTRYKIINTGK